MQQQTQRLSVPAFMAEHGLFDVPPQEALAALAEAGYHDVTTGQIYVARNAAKRSGKRVAPVKPGPKPAATREASPAAEPATEEAPDAPPRRLRKTAEKRAQTPKATRPGLRRTRGTSSETDFSAFVAQFTPAERDFIRLGIELGQDRSRELSAVVSRVLQVLWGDQGSRAA